MKRALIISLLTLPLLLPGFAFAQTQGGGNLPTQGGSNLPTQGGGNSPTQGGSNSIGTCGQQEGALKNPLKFCSLPELLNAILDAVIQIGAILLTVMLVWVGFLFVAAQGNSEKLSTARAALIWTLIGGLILLGAKAISEVVQATVQSL